MVSLFKRITDILSANINDLIDRVEDPEVMIKQVILEMEDNIGRAREGVVDAIASEKQLQKELDSNRKQSEEWLAKAELALREGKEDLAKSALTRKKECDDICRALQSSCEMAKTTSEQLKVQLRGLEAKLDEARRKRGTLVARQRAAEARSQMDSTLSHVEAGLASQKVFSRMEDKVTAMEARTEAMTELTDVSDRVNREFRDLEVEKEVADELARLKDKIQKS